MSCRHDNTLKDHLWEIIQDDLPSLCAACEAARKKMG